MDRRTAGIVTVVAASNRSSSFGDFGLQKKELLCLGQYRERRLLRLLLLARARCRVRVSKSTTVVALGSGLVQLIIVVLLIAQHLDQSGLYDLSTRLRFGRRHRGVCCGS